MKNQHSNNSRNATAAKNTPKYPTHALFHVTEGKDDKNHWVRIGAAWPHKDGKGMSISLDLLPRDGRISMRLIETQSDNAN